MHEDVDARSATAPKTCGDGEAFREAKLAVEHGDFDKARALYPHMLTSDRGVIEREIGKKQAADSPQSR